MLCLSFCLGSSASAAPSSTSSPLIAVPPMRSLVTDTSGALTPTQQAALREKLDDLQARVGPQLAVLVVPTTKGEDIAAYATRAFAQWQLGTKKDNDGLLILVALKDRRMRIEVGKGLESRVPDILAGRIIDEQMAPRFRQSDVYGGIDAAVDALIDRLGGRTVVGAAEVGDDSPVVSTETPTQDAPHERHLTPFGWAVLAALVAVLGCTSYRWRVMRFVAAGLAVIVASIWGVSRLVGNGESAFLIVIGGGFAAVFGSLILGVTGFGMRAAYRRSRIGFTVQWLIVLGITGYVAYATEGESIPILIAGAMSMLFVFAASLGGNGGGDSSDDDDSSSSSSSGSSSSSSSNSSGGGGSSSGGGASGSW